MNTLLFFSSFSIFACRSNSSTADGIITEEEIDNLVGDSDRPLGWNPEHQSISNTSSSSASIAWSPFTEEFSRYELVLLELESNREERKPVEKDRSSLEITGLKSDTIYQLQLLVCYDEDCSESAAPVDEEGNDGSLEIRTEKERWVLRRNASRNNYFPIVLPYTAGIFSLPTGEFIENAAVGSHLVASLPDTMNYFELGGIDIDLSMDDPVVFEQINYSSIKGDLLGYTGTNPMRSASFTPREENETKFMRMFMTITDHSVPIYDKLIYIDSTDGFEGLMYTDDYNAACVLPEPCPFTNVLQTSATNNDVPLDGLLGVTAVWESFEQENFGATNPVSLLLESKTTVEDSPWSLFLVEEGMGSDFPWTLVSDPNTGEAKALIESAIYPAIVNDAPQRIKIYYSDADSHELRLRYWHAVETPDGLRYDLDNLEDRDARSLELFDAQGDPLPPEALKQLERKHLFQRNPEEGSHLLFVRVKEEGTYLPLGLTVFELENP